MKLFQKQDHPHRMDLEKHSMPNMLCSNLTSEAGWIENNRAFPLTLPSPAGRGNAYGRHETSGSAKFLQSIPNIQRPIRKYAWRMPVVVENWKLNEFCRNQIGKQAWKRNCPPSPVSSPPGEDIYSCVFLHPEGNGTCGHLNDKRFLRSTLNSWKLNVERFLDSMVDGFRFWFKGIFALPALLLAGCSTADHSPTVDVLGSYFPAWMVCIVLGLALTLITRQIFIGSKLNNHLHPVALVYVCLMVFYTLAIWLLFFKN